MAAFMTTGCLRGGSGRESRNLHRLEPWVRSGMDGRAKPLDWLNSTHISSKVEGVVVKTSSPIDHHGSASPVSQSASLVYVTSPRPPTLPLRETLGQNSRRTPPLGAPASSSSSLDEEGSTMWRSKKKEEERRRRMMGMRRRQRGRRENRDCKIKAGLFEEKLFALSHHRTSIC